MLLLFLFIIGILSTFNYNVNEQLTYKYVGSTYTEGSENKENENIEISSLMKLVCLEKDEEKQMYKMTMVLEDLVMGNTDDEGTTAFFDGEYGAWLVFDLSFKGEVGNLYGEEPDEDEDYLQVKYNALDALQTYYEHGGMTDGIVSFTGLNGIVNSKIKVEARDDGDSDIVERSYNQNDFDAFADPSIKELIEEENVFHFAGVHTHEIENGIIKNAVIRHEHKMHAEPTDSDDNDEDGDGEAFIFGEGKTIITLVERKTLTRKEIISKIGVRDYSDENTNSLFSFGKEFAEDNTNAQGIFDIEEKIVESLDIIMNLGAFLKDNTELKAHKLRLYHANKLIYFLRGNPDLYKYFSSQISCEAFQPSHRMTKETMFFILAELGTKESQDDMIYHGYHGFEVESQWLAILASSNLDSPTEELFSALLGIFTNDEMTRDLKNTALLVYGILVDRVKDNEKKVQSNKDGIDLPKVMEKKLLLLLEPSKMKDHNVDDITCILYALLNAEAKLTSEVIYNQLIALGIEKITELANKVYSGAKISLPTSDASDFPYSKGEKYSKKLGEKYAKVTASAEYFAGTNFNCNQNTFNYKAYGELKADAKVLGKSKSLVHGRIIYGKKGSSVVGNEMFMSLLGKTIYQKTLTTLNCKQQTKNLYHTQKVFKVSYTVMVGPVPLKLKVSGDIVLNVDYAWTVCDKNLYAELKLIPGVSLVLSGSASVSVAVVKGGAYIDVSFNVKLKPTVYIKGTNCLIGAKMDLEVTPFIFDFGLYYRRRGCKTKRWKIKCGWKSKKKKKLLYKKFSSIKKTLWKREYKIK